MVTELFSQRCKIYESVAGENAIGRITYTRRYLNNNLWIKCRFDSLRFRSSEDVNPGARRAEIRGMLYVLNDEKILNNFVAEVDTDGIVELDDDGKVISGYEFEFEIFSVNPVYGYAGSFHHQELEVVDVGHQERKGC